VIVSDCRVTQVVYAEVVRNEHKQLCESAPSGSIVRRGRHYWWCEWGVQTMKGTWCAMGGR